MKLIIIDDFRSKSQPVTKKIKQFDLYFSMFFFFIILINVVTRQRANIFVPENKLEYQNNLVTHIPEQNEQRRIDGKEPNKLRM